jgi:4a-hydroxytetrahydrobiopterin dehydratase
MREDLDHIASRTIGHTALSAGELAAPLGALGSRWSVTGRDLRLLLKGPMAKAGEVAARAGALADELNHHPHMVIDYQRFELTIHSHDRDAITDIDLVFAARLEQWLRSGGWD